MKYCSCNMAITAKIGSPANQIRIFSVQGNLYSPLIIKLSVVNKNYIYKEVQGTCCCSCRSVPATIISLADSVLNILRTSPIFEVLPPEGHYLMQQQK